MNRLALITLTSCLSLAVACPTVPVDEDTDCAFPCAPGETQICLCAAGEEGVQNCGQDGCSWSSCECEPGDDDTTGDDDTGDDDTGDDDTGDDDSSPVDADGDGWTADEDCDDQDPAVHPGADELCDGVDNDCDGLLAEGGEEDADGDDVMGCAGDCDDGSASSYPGHAEICDGLDNDCDGSPADSEVDLDGDGVMVCQLDCDDADPTVYPGAPELCDGLDNDCNIAMRPDEIDLDGDGISECAGDCDDDNADAYPGAVEDCVIAGDEDCDGYASCDDTDCALAVECCSDDAYEPNDVKEASHSFVAPGSFSGAFCGTGEEHDYFVVEDTPYDSFVVYEVCAASGDIEALWEQYTGNDDDSATIPAGQCGSVGANTNIWDRESVLHLISWDSTTYTVSITLPTEDPYTECFNGVDNDGDGDYDCDDVDCSDKDRDGSKNATCEFDLDWQDCDDSNPLVGGHVYGFEGDANSCHDGIDNSCNGQTDCYDVNCGDWDPECQQIGCRPEDQEASEPNNDAFTAQVIQLGEVVEGATCVPGDVWDYYRLNGIAEGWEMRCTLEWLDNLGRQTLGAGIFDPSAQDGFLYRFMDEPGIDPPPTVVDVVAGDEQAGDWILWVLPNDEASVNGSNRYTLNCVRTGGVAVETDCDDGVDQDLDGDIDCEDSECTGDEHCPCVPTDTITCNTPVLLDMGAGTDDYYQYPCTPSGHLGTEQILEFEAPLDGDYTFAASVYDYGNVSDDLDVHVIDADTACRYGTCLATGNADNQQPVVSSVYLQAGQIVHFVLDGNEGITDVMEVEALVGCPGSCPDADFDGYQDQACGYSDCDDSNPLVNPGVVESCDYVDVNCDPNDEPWEHQWLDQDGDGEGNPDTLLDLTCWNSPGYVFNDLDCDDADASQNTGAAEVCENNEDDNCDGSIDEGCDETDCSNSVDDDGDGSADCDDPDCYADVVCTNENCTNGADDDGDGLEDCDDPECSGEPDCLDCVVGQCCYDDTLSVTWPTGSYDATINTWDDEDGPRGLGYYYDDIEFFAQAGVELVAEITSATFDSYLYLLDQDCTVIAEDEDGGVGQLSRIEYTLPTEGVYTVIVTTSATGDEGDYVFQLNPAVPGLETLCNDNVDEDHDGAMDCDDPDCSGDPACGTPEDCNNGADDDGDGFVDCEDLSCEADVACPVAITSLSPSSLAQDGTATVQIHGSNFMADAEGDSPRLYAGPGIEVTDKTYVSSSLLLATFTVPCEVEPGAVTVEFAQPNELLHTECASLGRACEQFTVTENLACVPVFEDCVNDLDDDADGDIDCLDADCFGGQGCEDNDMDGLADSFEFELADRFAPELLFDLEESCANRAPMWTALPSPSGYGEISIFYALSYVEDCGDGSHRGDTEFIVVEVERDLSDTWYVERVFMSGHYKVPVSDSSGWYDWWELEMFDSERPAVYVAKGKHANYSQAGEYNGLIPEPHDGNGASGTVLVEQSRDLDTFNAGIYTMNGHSEWYRFVAKEFCGWQEPSIYSEDRTNCAGAEAWNILIGYYGGPKNSYYCQLFDWETNTLDDDEEEDYGNGCDDGIDNDGDGRVDTDDCDCL